MWNIVNLDVKGEKTKDIASFLDKEDSKRFQTGEEKPVKEKD